MKKTKMLEINQSPNFKNLKLPKKIGLFLILNFLSLIVSAQSIESQKDDLHLKKWKEEIYTSLNSWAIDPQNKKSSLKLIESWKFFDKKKDVITAVVDTGIQFDHPDLRNNLFVFEDKLSEKNFGIDFSSGKKSKTPDDTHGHGTHVAGIIKAIYPEVKILPLKYYNPKSSGQENLDATIKALEYAVDQNVDIINYSGGGPESSAKELEILRRAQKKGILIIAAAGNEKSNIDIKKNAYYPASYGLSNIITVGAYDENITIIPSSNWGEKSVDIAAPGYRIRSAIPNNGKGFMTGTSQATAFVTGVAALIKATYPELNFMQIKNIILSSAPREKSLEGKVLGSGRLDAESAMIQAGIVHQKLFGTVRSVANSKK